MTMKTIPLNKLRHSEHNVRKNGAEVNLDALMANIEAKGVRQNLVGGISKKKGFYDIFAGGRRLTVLNRLADAGKIKKTHGVSVFVGDETGEDAAEISFAENYLREKMTPTDECQAYLHFLGKDGDIDAVAIRFGQTRRFIEGRLRLATLAEVIFDRLAAGEMTMDIAKAYAATPDQAKQIAVFEEVKGSWLENNAHEIRKRILGASIPASHPVAILVGEEAYTKAGGRVERDLFTEVEAAEWLDGDMAIQLAGQLMQDAAAAHAEESGVGQVIPLLAKASTWTDREDLTSANLDRAPLSKKAEKRIEQIEQEHAEIEQLCESSEMDEDDYDEINKRVEKLEQEEAKLRDTKIIVDDERKAALTQFLVIGEDGKPYIEPSYWEAPRAHKASDDDHPKDPKKVEAKAQGLSAVLADELSLARRDILALHIASNPAIALDLAIFSLADNAIGNHYERGCSLEVARRNDPSVRGTMPDSLADAALGEIRNQLNTSWSEFPTPSERFDAFRDLEEEDRAAWLAVSMAGSIEASLGGKGLHHSNPFHDHLGQILDIDVAAWWRPTAGGYFTRVRKAGMQTALNQIGGPELAGKYASSKVAEMADACEKLCDGSAITEPEIKEAGIAWLPAAMRFDPNAANEPDVAQDEEPESEESGTNDEEKLDDQTGPDQTVDEDVTTETVNEDA